MSSKRKDENVSHITGDVLVRLCKGDHEAFEKVFTHYIDSTVDFLSILSGSRVDAEEIAQETFIILWEKRETINPEGNISGYIYTIARNLTMNLFERRKTVEKFSSSYIDDSYDLAPDEKLIAKEKESIIEGIIENMPPQRKKIYRLSRVDNLSNSEIAERLNISKNTVENHITSALNDIRKAIGLLSMFL